MTLFSIIGIAIVSVLFAVSFVKIVFDYLMGK